MLTSSLSSLVKISVAFCNYHSPSSHCTFKSLKPKKTAFRRSSNIQQEGPFYATRGDGLHRCPRPRSSPTGHSFIHFLCPLYYLHTYYQRHGYLYFSYTYSHAHSDGIDFLNSLNRKDVCETSFGGASSALSVNCDPKIGTSRW